MTAERITCLRCGNANPPDATECLACGRVDPFTSMNARRVREAADESAASWLWSLNRTKQYALKHGIELE